MKTLPAALSTHIRGNVTSLATALKITREDGTVYGFTSHDKNDTVSGVTYSATPGLDVSDIMIAANAAVGNLELTTLHDGTLFTTAEVLGGVWRNATFSIFRYNFNSISDGIDTLLAGTFGEVEIRQNVLVIELRDLRQYLQQPVGDASSKTCRARLGDTRCAVRVNPPEWAATTAYTVRAAGGAETGSVVKPTNLSNHRHFKCTTAGTSGGSEPSWNNAIDGTTNDGTVVWTTIQALTMIAEVSGVTNNQVFSDGGGLVGDDYFNEGKLTWTSGANIGLSAKIKSYAGGWITLALPMYETVANGDTYSAVAGCRKRIAEDCATKFDNVLNFVGEPHRQGINSLTQSPASDV